MFSKNNASSSSSLLIDERKEVMISGKGYILKKTHFLKPINDSSLASDQLPRLSVSSSSPDIKLLSSRISFSGFWFSERYFVSWLGKMEALHEPTWRKAGIFEAIKASTYNITKNQTLILSVAEKWCPDTKSFLFPWGEATITLEDVMVLLGFSVLGSPAFLPVESLEMRDTIEKLDKVRLQCRNSDSRANQISWISEFLGRGDQVEHEAFLVLWLSHFVFPGTSRRSITKDVFPIAIRLARGEKIALAPAVLAFIYRDLSRIHDLTVEKCGKKVNVMSLFKLVQVWTWERFSNTRPKVREIAKGEPRISRWDSLAQRSLKNEESCFDEFDWRPYTKPLKNWNPLRFYVDEAMCVTVDADNEFASFAKWVRASLLVGDGFVENYYPNRVAMQFGFDQDVPGLVTRRYRDNFTEKDAWDDYNKSLDGLKLHMPSRLARGSVTKRYHDWWLKSVSRFQETSESLKGRKIADHYDDDDDDDVDLSPKVVPLSQVVQKLEKEALTKRRRSRTRGNRDKRGKLASGWRVIIESERSNYKRARVDNDDDEMTIAQKIRSRSDREKARGDGSETLRKRRKRYKVVETDESDDDSRTTEKIGSIKTERMSEDNDETEKKMQICNDGAKESESCVHEDGEKQRYKKEEEEEEIDERLRQRKLAIEEMASKLEARMVKVEKDLVLISDLKTKGNKIEQEVYA